MAFHDVQFPTDISKGSSGGPMRRTDIVTLRSGAEERNAIWANSRHVYDAGMGLRNTDDLYEVIQFFEARNGRLHAFRWKDWSDYRSGLPRQAVTAFDQDIGTGDGATVAFQLSKTYTSGANSYTRDITKPVEGTVLLAYTIATGAELIADATDMQTTNWSNDGATGAADGSSYGVYTSAYKIGVSGAGVRRWLNGGDWSAITGGETYRVVAIFKEDVDIGAQLRARCNLTGGNEDSIISGPFAAPVITDQSAGPVTNVTSTDLGGGFWQWTFDVTIDATATKCGVCPGNLNAGDPVIIMGASLRTVPTTEVVSDADYTINYLTGIVTFDAAPSALTTVSAGFEFDVPARFDMDYLSVSIDAFEAGAVPSISVIEVRE